jgi:hypothetical protein
MRKDVSNEVRNTDSVNEREKKRRAIYSMLATCPGAEVAGQLSASYVDALRVYPIEVVRAACESLRDSWTNEYGPPQPGHVRAACQRFQQMERSEINRVREEERMAKAKRETMTYDWVLGELARVHDIPLPEDEFERRVEKRRRESLDRILRRWEGEDIPPRYQRRGEGGLMPVGDFLEGV